MSEENSVSGESHPAPAGLLEGIRVLDLTNVLSGPFCTYQMSMLGAEVIKVENPKGGDLARQLGASPELNRAFMGTSFLAQNAGKKSVTLNLKTERGVEIFKSLVKTADVVVENFRPGVMKRLGIDYEALKACNPGLVYCAISGFGQSGPLRNNPAYDQIVQGMSGVMSVTGDETLGSAPMRVGFPVCDSIGGLTAAFAIVSALLSRQHTGKGQAIDVSMLDSSIVTMGWVVSNYLIAGVTPKAMGNQNMTAAPSGAFQTGNGLLNIAANKQEQFEALCKIIGRQDLIDDERFAQRDARKANREALNVEITRALLDESAEHWESLFNQAGIPSGRVLSVPEILSHQQVVERNLVQGFDTPDFDKPLKVTRAGYRLSGSEVGARSTPPRLGEHASAVLAEIGIDESELDTLRQNGIA